MTYSLYLSFYIIKLLKCYKNYKQSHTIYRDDRDNTVMSLSASFTFALEIGYLDLADEYDHVMRVLDCSPLKWHQGLVVLDVAIGSEP